MPEDLLRKYPNLKEFWPFLHYLNNESDRGMVLIGTGFIEELLKQVLLAYLLDNKVAVELVKGGSAPLGTLSARINAAYVLGLVSEVEYDDLCTIRRIRNEFAHNIHSSFADQSIVDRCSNLKHKAHDYGDVIVSPRGQFNTAIVGVILNLVNRPHYVGQKRVRYEEWPY